MRVFVSSTSKDLADHRAAVRDAILKLGMHPIMMEHFPAMDANALDACQRKVLDCDLFVGIYAHRYGYIPADQGKSITELEYDWAVAADLPRRVFVVKPDYEWPHESSDMGDDYTKLDAFKKRVGSERVWSEFTTPDSLAAAVTQSLVHDAERLSREQKKQRRLMVGGLATIALLIIGVIAAVVLTKTDEKQIGISQADRASTNQARATSNTEATQTIIALTPTPLAHQAVGGEILVLLAQFNVIDEDATRVDQNLISEFNAAKVHFAGLPYTLPSGDSGRDEARAESERHNATMVIWGEVARGGARIYFEITPRRGQVETPVDDITYAVTDLTSFDTFVFEGMGLVYIVEFIRGQILFFEADYQAAIEALETAAATLEAGTEAKVKAAALFFYLGYAYGQVGKVDEQLSAYNRALELDPDLAAAFNNRGKKYIDIGNYTAALEDLSRALELQPDSAIIYLNRGNALFKLTDYSRAIADYNRAIELQPEDPLVFYARATAYLAIQDYAAANSDYSRAIEIQQDFAEAYIGRGATSAYIGDYASAINDIDRALELQPDLAEAWAHHATMLAILGDYTSAIAEFDRALGLQPDLAAEAYFNRGVAAAELGNYEVAIADYNQAIELQPNLATPYSRRGFSYMFLGNSEDAVADFSHALQLQDDLVEAYIGRGNAYANLHEYAAAMRDYNRALQLDSDSADSYNLRGLVYIEYGELGAAFADFGRAIELQPDFVDAYVNRGDVYAHQNDYTAAIADYNLALELQPDFADALLGRAAAYMGQNLDAAAFADYNRAIELWPDYARAYFSRGVAYLDLEYYSTAIQDFDRAIELQPNDAAAYFNRGYAHALLEEYEKAILDCDIVIELEPSNPDAYGLRGASHYFLDDFEAALLDLREYVRLAGETAEPALLDLLSDVEAEIGNMFTNPRFANGSSITLPDDSTILLYPESMMGEPSAYCSLGSEATIIQTVELREGLRVVQLECDGGTGWIYESELLVPE